jgi:hypothetical protein
LAKGGAVNVKDCFNHRLGRHTRQWKTGPNRSQWLGDDDWTDIWSFQQSQFLGSVEANR